MKKVDYGYIMDIIFDYGTLSIPVNEFPNILASLVKETFGEKYIVSINIKRVEVIKRQISFKNNQMEQIKK